MPALPAPASAPYTSITPSFAKAIQGFQSSEISFMFGEYIFLIGQQGDEYIGRSPRNQRGAFPKAYVFISLILSPFLSLISPSSLSFLMLYLQVERLHVYKD
jgi:hypothetical protein